MITTVSLKGDPPTLPSNGPRMIGPDSVDFSVPIFEGAEFREARIFMEPGEVIKMELLFVCEKLPAKESLMISSPVCCRYNNLKTGVIGQDYSCSPDWNRTYQAQVGWHWVTVLCWLSDFSIIATSGTWNDLIGGRQTWGAFQDYHQNTAKLADDMGSCAQSQSC